MKTKSACPIQTLETVKRVNDNGQRYIVVDNSQYDYHYNIWIIIANEVETGKRFAFYMDELEYAE